jgi:hypothetical protein
VQSADEEPMGENDPDQGFRDFTDFVSLVDNDDCHIYRLSSLPARSIPLVCNKGQFIITSILVETSCERRIIQIHVDVGMTSVAGVLVEEVKKNSPRAKKPKRICLES